MRTTSALAFAASWMVTAPCALAQGGGTATIVLEQPASARALSMGAALVAASDGDASLFSNPALLTLHRRPSASMSGQRYIAGSSLGALSASRTAFGGTIGAGVRALDYGREREVVPDTLNFGGQRGVETGRQVSASEIVLSMGYARARGPLRIGAAVSYLRQQVVDVSGGTPSLDAGVAIDLPRGATAGLAIQHVGPDLAIASTSSPLPRTVRVGASAPFRMGAFAMLVAGEAMRLHDGAIVPRAGLELSLRTANGIAISGRGGARGGNTTTIGRLTLGAGIEATHVALDYAYQNLEVLGGTAHRIGVRFQR